MKKIISAVLLLGMLAGMLGIGAAAQEYVVDDAYTLGDVNGDGYIDAVDAFDVVRYLADVEGASLDRNAADMDADGNVTVLDSLQFRLCLAEVKQWSDYEITEGYGQALYNLTIADNPINTYCIVVPADANPDTSNAYYSAQVLQRHIWIATGFEPEIVFGEKSTENAIVFHQEDLYESELGLEEYIYSETNGQLDIYGTRRGCMYAVYEILEEYLGFLFYSGDATLIHKNRMVDIPEDLYMQREPLMHFRMVRGGTFGIPNALQYYFPRRNNGSQLSAYEGEKYGTLTGTQGFNAHSFHGYYQMATGPADAPTLWERYEQGDRVDQLNWQPCFTNDDMYELLFEGLVLYSQYLYVDRANNGNVFRPETSLQSFSICDNTASFCKCSDCSTLYETDGYAGGSVYIANRAAKDIQEYYPGMRIFFIEYDHTIPQTIFPDENVVVMFCGMGCNNHILGSEGCGDGLTLNGGNNNYDEKALKAWGEICAQTGAELWFWYYPCTYSYWLVGSPNIVNIYEDYKWLVNECGVTGLYFESDEIYNNFEALKEYLASRVIADPDMTEDEFYDIMREYLRIYYGDGYEELFQFIMMQNEAGDRAGCFQNGSLDRPRQMFDYKYIDDNYEEMRALLVTARDKANTDAQRTKIDTLLACCDFLGLTCVHHRYYKNNTDNEELRQLYMERYDAMYNYIKENDIPVFPSEQYGLPAEISYEEDPMYQIYGAERPGVSRYPAS